MMKRRGRPWGLMLGLKRDTSDFGGTRRCLGDGNVRWLRHKCVLMFDPQLKHTFIVINCEKTWTWRFFPKQFSPNSLLLGVLNSFLRCVRLLCHCWCPPFSAGHVAFLFICLPGLSLLVSALFRWPCRNSIHLSPRSVTDGLRPFPLAM